MHIKISCFCAKVHLVFQWCLPYITLIFIYEIKINEPLLDWVTGVHNNVIKLVIDNRKLCYCNCIPN